MGAASPSFDTGQRDVLEHIATGKSLGAVLEEIVTLVERESQGMQCSILIVDREAGRIRDGAAPSLPVAYTRSIDGAPIGPQAGSCGAAAALGERVIVEDIATHPYWDAYRHLALPFGLRACWSTPIFSDAHVVLGTFAMYYREPRGPTESELRWVDAATQLASVALSRHEAERVRAALESQVAHAQRMESLGTLAGGIAHDFNNILTSILMNARLALDDTPAEGVARDALREVLRASERAKDLVASILTFSRQGEPRRGRMEIAPVLGEAVQLLRASLPARIQIQAHVAPDVPAVLADAIQIHQIVMNLGTNAAHAMARRRGRLEIRADRVVLDEEKIVGTRVLPPGVYARLGVSDDGEGMDEVTLGRIFDPFFTTKGQGEGTGLGLSVVHGIVQGQGGGIAVQSTPGRGTTFELYFPEAPGGDAQVPRPEADELLLGRGQHVLCVDDEVAIARVTGLLLERLGYRTTVTSDPIDALTIFEASPDAFDAVFLDSSMPGLSGLDLAQAILKLRPALPLVLTTGLLEPEDAQIARLLGIREIILKPYTMADLGPALHRALGD